MPIDLTVLQNIDKDDSIEGLTKALHAYTESENIALLEHQRANGLKQRELEAKEKENAELRRRNDLSEIRTNELQQQTVLMRDLYTIMKQYITDHFEDHHKPIQEGIKKIDNRVWFIIQVLNTMFKVLVKDSKDTANLRRELEKSAQNPEMSLPQQLIFNVGNDQTNLSSGRDVKDTQISEGDRK